MLTLRTILHPTDFSGPSRTAFGLACALARDYGAGLVVAHVAPPPLSLGSGGVPMAAAVPDATDVRRLLGRVRPADPGVAVRYRMTVAPPVFTGAEAEGILAVAAEERADLIVMGTHGRSGLSRLLMGSVAEQVLRKAPCPVLTVRVPLPGEANERPDGSSASNPAAVTNR